MAKQKHEWEKEPSVAKFIDKQTGFRCMILRNPTLKHLCGYVAVDAKSPLCGIEYSANIFRDIDVHGGLTFAGKITIECSNDNLYWFGFDAAHVGDITPFIYEHSLTSSDYVIQKGCEYRNMEYMEKQCKKLAKQLKEILDKR
ncbi:MAG: hypothetical protein BV459_01855 [Thermoplasmata archaeon M11B2D]|nr:MAG: hypothetical protein BV459_01855 [Thermoplasmata archaeon M11B2D]